MERDFVSGSLMGLLRAVDLINDGLALRDDRRYQRVSEHLEDCMVVLDSLLEGLDRDVPVPVVKAIWNGMGMEEDYGSHLSRQADNVHNVITSSLWVSLYDWAGGFGKPFVSKNREKWLLVGSAMFSLVCARGHLLSLCYTEKRKTFEDVLRVADDSVSDVKAYPVAVSEAHVVSEWAIVERSFDGMSDDELRDKLRANGISFHPNLGRKRLLLLLKDL